MRDISEGISLFNGTDFFSAHDFFEDCWIECDRNERLFFQGMVQVSVGFYHLLNENYKGSSSQFLKGINKLNIYRPYFKNINLEKLIADIELIMNSLKENSFTQDPEKFWNLIPKLEITK